MARIRSNNSDDGRPSGAQGGPTKKASPAASTTQSLDRAMKLLDIVVREAGHGIALPQLSDAAGLSRPTVHRLVNGLRNAGLVDYNPETRLFSPAFKLFQMGQSIASRFDLTTLVRPSMERIAQATEDTVYLSVRSGDQAICIDRCEGSFPIKTLTLEVGDSRPLGLGAGSLALLAELPDDECRQVIARNTPLLADHANFTAEKLAGYISTARSKGYALNFGLMHPEMAAVGVPLRSDDGQWSAALSVATITSRMADDRLRFIVELLHREAEDLRTRVWGGS